MTTHNHLRARSLAILLGAGFAAASLALAGPAAASTSAASAAPVVAIDGPLDLGSAEPYAVLGSTEVTDAGTSTIDGRIGVSPGTSFTGFPAGLDTEIGTGAAAEARDDLTAAYGVAASLTPSDPTTSYAELGGLRLVPGVYAGGALSLTGTLRLDGDSDSVWVFQAASELTVAASSRVVLEGDADACNVFWKVGSSATLLGGADFVGTILADASITAVTDATVEGRLLARTGAVTLDDNTITRPDDCADASDTEVTSSPRITSDSPKDGTVGDDYRFTVDADGTPDVEYEVTAGTLPPGLELDGDTGEISGTPTEVGTFSFTITASNGAGPDDERDYDIVIAAAGSGSGGSSGGSSGDDSPTELAETGFGIDDPATLATAAMLLGAGLVVATALTARRRRPASRHRVGG